MMTISDYKAYLDCFNRKDYGAVLTHFTDDCEVIFAGYCFKGHQAVRDFYAFFHQYVGESITLSRFVADDTIVALEAVVRLEGIEALSIGRLEQLGLGRLFPLEKGQVIEVPQFIHYHMRDGKFSKAICTVFDPPVETIMGIVEGG